MTKKPALILSIILAVLLVFLAVFSIVPSFSYGTSGVYYSPLSLIQRGSGLAATTTVTATIRADSMEENVDFNANTRLIRQRLGKIYGYYGADVKVNDGKSVTLSVFQPNFRENGVQADTVISNVLARGKVEVFNTSATDYHEEDALISNTADVKYFKNARVKTYSNDGSSYYSVDIELTDAGYTAISGTAGLTGTTTMSTTSGIIAIDETLLSSTFSLFWTGSTSHTIMAYTTDEGSARSLASFVNLGALDFEFGNIGGYVDTEANAALGTVCFVAFVAVLLACAAYIFIKYNVFGVAYSFSVLITLILVLLIAGLAFAPVLNIWMVVGAILGFAAMTVATAITFEAVKKHYDEGKTLKYAISLGFKQNWLKVLIIDGGLLVLGAILWLIPTAFSVSMGCALVYIGVMSFAVTFGLNRFFASVLSANLIDDKNAKRASRK
jgi:preprotein translocase subunit SecD